MDDLDHGSSGSTANRNWLAQAHSNASLSQTGADRSLATDPRTVLRWCAGEREMAGPAEAMLMLLDRLPAVLPVLESLRWPRSDACGRRTNPFDGDEGVACEV